MTQFERFFILLFNKTPAHKVQNKTLNKEMRVHENYFIKMKPYTNAKKFSLIEDLLQLKHLVYRLLGCHL